MRERWADGCSVAAGVACQLLICEKEILFRFSESEYHRSLNLARRRRFCLASFLLGGLPVRYRSRPRESAPESLVGLIQPGYRPFAVANAFRAQHFDVFVEHDGAPL